MTWGQHGFIHNKNKTKNVARSKLERPIFFWLNVRTIWSKKILRETKSFKHGTEHCFSFVLSVPAQTKMFWQTIQCYTSFHQPVSKTLQTCSKKWVFGIWSGPFTEFGFWVFTKTKNKKKAQNNIHKFRVFEIVTMRWEMWRDLAKNNTAWVSRCKRELNYLTLKPTNNTCDNCPAKAPPLASTTSLDPSTTDIYNATTKRNLLRPWHFFLKTQPSFVALRWRPV